MTCLTRTLLYLLQPIFYVCVIVMVLRVHFPSGIGKRDEVNDCLRGECIVDRVNIYTFQVYYVIIDETGGVGYLPVELLAQGNIII